MGAAPSVMLLESIQMPCKLTLRCSDGRDAPFLAKSGEDLRQDARIQRLFTACGAAMGSSPRCRARVVTFHVEPLSTRCGLLAWLPASAPLKEVVDSELSALGCNAHRANEDPASAHKAFAVKRGAPPSTPASPNWRSLVLQPHSKLPAGEAEAHHAALRDTLFASAPSHPPSFAQRCLLRSALLRSFRSAEAFLAARARLGATLAGACAAGYVAGVGDRHPGNLLLLPDGAIALIDFGYAFGTGTRLPVAECVVETAKTLFS